MNYFTFKEPYSENGRKVLEFGILPEKWCTFNCAYCPVSRQIAHHRTNELHHFEPVEDSLAELARRVLGCAPDLLFINSKGEALYSDRLPEVIGFCHDLGLPVRLLSNGYPYGEERFAAVAATCEEVIGELKSGREDVFQRIQRPVAGATLEQYERGMAAFCARYQGRFILEITVVKKFSDDPESIAFFRRAVAAIRPDELRVITVEDEPFARTLAVSAEKLEEVRMSLLEARDSGAVC